MDHNGDDGFTQINDAKLDFVLPLSNELFIQPSHFNHHHHHSNHHSKFTKEDYLFIKEDIIFAT
jgi:hypothetical protein